MPGAPSSFLLLVVRPGAPSSVLAAPCRRDAHGDIHQVRKSTPTSLARLIDGGESIPQIRVVVDGRCLDIYPSNAYINIEYIIVYRVIHRW